jgi:tetratricopeptide (TPR) repeat protein
MKWSWTVGRFWGTEFRLHLSLLLIVPYTLIVFQPDTFSDAVRVLLLITAIFVCVAIHELGHTLAARIYNIPVTSIVLWPLGGFANLSRRPDSVWQDLVISAAGPLANLFIFSLLAILVVAERLLLATQMLPSISNWLISANVFPFLAALTLANLILAIFNLVPIYPLDGGQIARGLLKLLFGEKTADILMILLSLPLALGLAVFGAVVGDVVILLTGGLLMLASLTLNTRLTNAATLGVLYFFDRGGYYLKRNDFDPALQAYTRAIERSPNRAGLYVSRAVVYLNLMDYEKARADLSRALTFDKENHIAWALHGEIFSLENRLDEALAAYNRAIEIRPNWAIAYLDRGRLRQELGDLISARSDMDKAVELGQGSIIVYVLRSVLRFQMGDLQGARKDADQALLYAPQWMLVFPEAFLFNFKGQLPWAMDYYARAIERMPKAYQAYQGRADACRVNRRFAWALADYQRAINLAPKQAELYLSRGLLFRQMGLPEKAVEDFRQAEQLSRKSHIRRTARRLINPLPESGAQMAAIEPAE